MEKVRRGSNVPLHWIPKEQAQETPLYPSKSNQDCLREHACFKQEVDSGLCGGESLYRPILLEVLVHMPPPRTRTRVGTFEQGTEEGGKMPREGCRTKDCFFPSVT